MFILELKKYGENLVSRDLAQKISASIVQGETELQLDFTKVNTVTPSFSHELLSTIIQKNNSIKINFTNTNESTKLQLSKALSSIQKGR